MPEFPKFRRSLAAHLRFGRRGERVALRLVRSLGMKIICTNYNGPHGELDIVALDGDMLCFIEVKARRPSLVSRPADAVTLRKRWAIVRTAEHYLAQLNHPGFRYRFDIIEVIMDNRKLLELRYWPNEFTGDEVRNTMRHRVEKT